MLELNGEMRDGMIFGLESLVKYSEHASIV